MIGRISLQPVALSIACLAFGLAPVATGCGDGGETVAPFSCAASFPGADGGTMTPVVCVEVSGGTEQDLEKSRQNCVAQGNQFSLDPCTRAHAVGACRIGQSGITITTWYYDDGTGDPSVSTIREICAGIGVTFVAP